MRTRFPPRQAQAFVALTMILGAGACTPKSELASDSATADSAAADRTVTPLPPSAPDSEPAPAPDTAKRNPLTDRPVKSDPEPPPKAPVVPTP
jgi:hypothetical protein